MLEKVVVSQPEFGIISLTDCFNLFIAATSNPGILNKSSARHFSLL